MKVGDVLYARYLLFRGSDMQIRQGAPLKIIEIKSYKKTRKKDRFGRWEVTQPDPRLRVELLEDSYKVLAHSTFWVNPDDLEAI